MGNYITRNVKGSVTSKSKLLILVIGGPCSGKSSVTQRLAERFQLTPVAPDKIIRECVDRESLKKPEARLERVYRRRLRTFNAVLILNKVTEEEKQFFGETGESSWQTMAQNHYGLHAQSDSEISLQSPPLIKRVRNSVKNGEPIPPNVICTLIHDTMWYAMRRCNGFIIDGYPRYLEQYEYLVEMIGVPHLIIHLDCPDTEMIERALARAKASQRYDENEPFLQMKINAFRKHLEKLFEQWTQKDQISFVDVDATETLESVKEACVEEVEQAIKDGFKIKKYKKRSSKKNRKEKMRLEIAAMRQQDASDTTIRMMARKSVEL